MLDASNDDLSLLGHHQMCKLVSWCVVMFVVVCCDA